MRRNTLGATLRAILLAMPFVGASACCLSTVPDGDAGPVDSGLPSCGSADYGMLQMMVPDGGFPPGGCMALCDATLSGVYDCEVDYQRPSIFCCCCQEGSCCNTGRRPASLIIEAPRRHRCNPLGDYFRIVSRLEAASVEAFRLLGRELRAHGAPEQLRLQARRAAREELRHARLAVSPRCAPS